MAGNGEWPAGAPRVQGEPTGRAGQVRELARRVLFPPPVSGLRGAAWGLVRGMLDLVYPPLEPGTGAELGGELSPHLSEESLAKLQFIGDDRCRRCGLPLPVGAGLRPSCRSCGRVRLAFSAACCAVRYEGTARAFILATKLEDHPELAQVLGALLWAAVAADGFAAGAEAVVAVPMFKKTERQRGFNQAQELGRYVARRLGLPFLGRQLVKTRETPPQTTLPAAERRENLKGAFSATGGAKVAGKAVLLLDDVMTTGATAHECARALRRVRVKEVRVATVARAHLE